MEGVDFLEGDAIAAVHMVKDARRGGREMSRICNVYGVTPDKGAVFRYGTQLAQGNDGDNGGFCSWKVDQCLCVRGLEGARKGGECEISADTHPRARFHHANSKRGSSCPAASLNSLLTPELVFRPTFPTDAVVGRSASLCVSGGAAICHIWPNPTLRLYRGQYRINPHTRALSPHPSLAGTIFSERIPRLSSHT